MNYDRLLQLGGIDREVPPIPRYISKQDLQNQIDDLKEWKEEQETPNPDGQIKGIKEIENFLNGTSDSEHYSYYTDVYVGAGSVYTDVMIADNHHDQAMKDVGIEVTANDEYLFVILPDNFSPAVLMEGVTIPMTQDGTVTQDNVTYKVLKSENQYTDTFDVILV